MAKKSNTTPQNATSARIARTEAYAEKVRAMFAATVNRILELNKAMPAIPDGEMFSFDAQTEKLRVEVERCLRQLHSVATAAIQQGIRLEWETANVECDKIAQSVVGKKVLENPEFGAWVKRNNDAMRAFIARSDAGMTLSERVWQSTRQLRDEMEIAITVAVGDGTSAARMSRNVRKYLNDHDLMFRRFRYKDPETGEWRRKWKKRVIDPTTGKVRFIDYDKDSYHDQWTGRGYYKSSAQNAMRVARTETNIAYRRADNERWQQMDFVLGQRVQLSRSHPKKDICDKLAGDYPKDFVFDGWHPQCFCFVTPILIDEDEYDEIMSHDNWREELKRITDAQRITDYPDNFKSWVTDNADKIESARQRGTEPYFIRNNAGAIDQILNPQSKEITIEPLRIQSAEHSFVAAQSIDDAISRIQSCGIKEVNIDGLGLNEANILLQVVEEESTSMGGLQLDKLIVSEMRKERLNGRWVNLGGSYNADTNTLRLNSLTFTENVFHKPLSWDERISRCESVIASKRAEIEQYKAHLGKVKSKKFEKELKGYIQDAEWAIEQKRRDILKYQNYLENGIAPHSFTVASEFQDLTDQIKAMTHHEFGHYLHRHKLNSISFRSKDIFAPSDYGEKTDGELFAEWYAHYKMRGAKGVPSELLSIFENNAPSAVVTHRISETSFEKSLKKIRKSLVRQNHERMVIINGKGSVIAEINGNTRGVIFDEQTAAKLKNNTLTHNHPSGKGEPGIEGFGYSLSRDDVYEAVKCDMRGIVAESPQYRYMIQRPHTGWGVDADTIKKRYAEIYDEIKADYRTSLDIHNANNFIQHLVLKRLSAEFGFVYSYERI